MESVKYSIICPIFNSEKYLSECIDSVLRQSLKNWELLLIDDGSTDDSPNICDRYAGCYYNIHAFHQSNQGQFYARIVGIKKCHSKRIIFLDSDDWLSNNCLETIDKLFSDDCDILVFNMETFSNNDLSKRSFYMVQNNVYYNDDIHRFFYFDSFVFNLCRCCFNSRLFSDDVFISSDLSNSKIGEDSIFLEAIVKKAKMVRTINDVLYFYRMHTNSATHVISFDNALGRVMVLNHLYENIEVDEAYKEKVTERLSWAIVIAVMYGAVTLDYETFKTKMKDIYNLVIYKRFFPSFYTKSHFHKYVAIFFKRHMLFILYIYLRIFKKRATE